MALYARARRDCSDLLTAFELILRGGIEIALRRPARLRRSAVKALSRLCADRGVGRRPRSTCAAILEDFLADAGDLVEDGVVAASRAQAERLWLYREVMVEAQGRGGRYLRTDVSVPISQLADFVADALAGARRTPSRGAGRHLWPCRRRQSPSQRRAAGRAWRRGRSDALFHGAEALIFDMVDRYGGIDQRRARHRPGQAEGVPASGSTPSRSISPAG